MAGISLAPADYTMAPSPAWVRIDNTYAVQTWNIDRGRQNEMSRTGTGTARVELVDRVGDFDPTNSSSPFWGQLPAYPDSPMGPLVQAKIELQNPVTSTWSTLFRGFISQITWQPYQTKAFANVTLDLVDAMAVFAACEMPPGFAVEAGFADYIDGNIVFFEDLNLGPTHWAVQTRINKVLDAVGWDPSLRSIFTGNVQLQGWESRPSPASVYAPRSTVLQVLQDAADAEFPDIANLFIGGPRNPGKVVFHGRKARFDPTNPDYDLETWQLGDDHAYATLVGPIVRISPPLVASLDDTLLYTSALSTPQNVADGDIAGQYVEDATAVATKGLRTWSAENLLTRGGIGGTTALAETHKFAEYMRDNYATPKVRVGQLTVKTRRPDDPDGPQTWALFCGVDISDVVHLSTLHVGGGGFNDDFFVEGIHYQVTPGPGDFPIVELTLDVSPAGYYDSDPFT